MIQFLLVFVGFWHTLRTSFEDAKFRALLFNVVLLLTVGTLFYWKVEGWSLFNSLYFCVITLCTVGYGDFTPQTTLGRGFTMIYVFLGIGLIVAFASHFANQMVERREAHIVRHRGTDPNIELEEEM
jgi:voltage-gated potassium channel